MLRKVCIGIILCIFFCGCSSNQNHNEIKKENYTISTQEVHLLGKDPNVYIIDVRESHEYHHGHIENAYNIPLGNIESIQDFNLSKDQKIIVYCQSGNRSKKAFQQLRQLGYTEVYDMGGIENWEYELIKE